MWYQRDQFTNRQLHISDLNLIELQHSSRIHNHAASEKSKTPRAQPPTVPSIYVGDLIYITSDGSKCRARDRYLVSSIDGSWCNVRKFTGCQLRSTSYRVKLSECFRACDNSRQQAQAPLPLRKSQPAPMSLPPSLPQIPDVLAQPPSFDALPTHPFSSRPPPPHVIETGPNSLITPESQEQPIHVLTPTHTPVSSLFSETAHANPRRSSRVRRPPAYLEDFVV